MGSSIEHNSCMGCWPLCRVKITTALGEGAGLTAPPKVKRPTMPIKSQSSGVHASGLQRLVDRVPGAPERSRNRRDRNPAVCHVCRELLLLQGELGASSPFAPTGTSSAQACHDTIPNQFPLKLRKGPEHIEEQFALAGRGVHVRKGTVEHLQVDLALLQLVGQSNQMPQGARQAVQPPDDQRIPGVQVLPTLKEAGAVFAGARRLIAIEMPILHPCA